MTAGGTQPPIPGMMGRRTDRQKAVYRHEVRTRLLKADRVVTVCGNPRCLDHRHMHIIPAPKPPKAALICTDPAAGGLASSAAD